MVTRAIDHKYGSWFTNSSSVLPTSLVVYQHFSNPLHVIIQAAHQSIILVTWMGLETQWKPSENTAVFETIQSRMQIFFICILIKQQNTRR